MIKPIFLSAFMVASLGLGTGITAIDSVVVKQANAQNRGEVRCRFWTATNRRGTLISVTPGDGQTRRANFTGNRDNNVSSFAIRGNQSTGRAILWRNRDQGGQRLAVTEVRGPTPSGIENEFRNLRGDLNDVASSYECIDF